MNINETVEATLFSLKDEKYRDFHSALMPTVNKQKIIGVKTPKIRQLAKEFGKRSDINYFLDSLPHKYYEENNLHAVLIENIADYNKCILELDKFLPFVDNWATCDMITPKIFKTEPCKLYKKIKEWLTAPDLYTKRFAIRMLMCFYLDELFTPEVFDLVLGVKSDEYYIKMMVAWFFATAATKRYDEVKIILEIQKLNVWTHNKTISKCVDSLRISDEQKLELKSLRRHKD